MTPSDTKANEVLYDATQKGIYDEDGQGDIL
jgi:hypothetical protein